MNKLLTLFLALFATITPAIAYYHGYHHYHHTKYDWIIVVLAIAYGIYKYKKWHKTIE